jgi:tRNA/rRNA methyltransferase
MGKPAVILVRPQLGENIGKAARAMYNFGLTDLRLVSPRDGWPNPDAGPSAAGAGIVIEKAKVYSSVEDAIADCTRVYATTVRDRDMPKPVVTPRETAAQIKSLPETSQVGILFGPERSGLTNDDVVLADAVLTVPVNPDYGSLNLAQAVILVAYELFQQETDTPAHVPSHPEGAASKQEITGLMVHLEDALDSKGYFKSEGRRAKQVHTLRNLIQNSEFSSQEIQTLRGVVKSLSREVKK